MSILALQVDQQPLEVQTLAAKMKQVEQELIKQTPELPQALQVIHQILFDHEELVNLLDDDDIARLHQAHERFKNVHLFQKEVKAVGKAGKKKLSDNDLATL